MATRPGARGFSLIEVMIAMGVLLAGAIGLMGLHNMGVALNGDALRVTRATAVAQDLVTQLEHWDYDSAQLANASVTNDDDIGDAEQVFEREADPVGAGIADHGEATIAAMGAAWTGLPEAELGGIYERFWNVLDAGDARHVSVIVRWRHGAGWRRIVFHAVRPNPVRW